MNVTLEHEFDWHKTFFNVAQNGHGTHGANHNDGKILPRKKVSKTPKFLSSTKIGVFFLETFLAQKFRFSQNVKKGNFLPIFKHCVSQEKKTKYKSPIEKNLYVPKKKQANSQI